MSAAETAREVAYARLARFTAELRELQIEETEAGEPGAPALGIACLRLESRGLESFAVAADLVLAASGDLAGLWARKAWAGRLGIARGESAETIEARGHIIVMTGLLLVDAADLLIALARAEQAATPDTEASAA